MRFIAFHILISPLPRWPSHCNSLFFGLFFNKAFLPDFSKVLSPPFPLTVPHFRFSGHRWCSRPDRVVLPICWGHLHCRLCMLRSRSHTTCQSKRNDAFSRGKGGVKSRFQCGATRRIWQWLDGVWTQFSVWFVISETGCLHRPVTNHPDHHVPIENCVACFCFVPSDLPSNHLWRYVTMN